MARVVWGIPESAVLELKKNGIKKVDEAAVFGIEYGPGGAIKKMPVSRVAANDPIHEGHPGTVDTVSG